MNKETRLFIWRLIKLGLLTVLGCESIIGLFHAQTGFGLGEVAEPDAK